MLQQKFELSSPLTIEHHIQQWLTLRHDMLVHYSQVCVAPKESATEHLQIFCQTLMDYLAMGHFKMFETIARFHKDVYPHSRGIDTALLSKLNLTTDAALDFNDKYTDTQNLNALTNDLSRLGESLVHRMNVEDCLIKNYSDFYNTFRLS